MRGPFKFWVLCALLVLMLLAVADNLLFATDWNLVVVFLAFTLAPDVALESSILFGALALNWAVMIGISIITAMDSTLMDNACESVGCPMAWTGNVIIHYIPPFLLLHYVLRIVGIRSILPFLQPQELLCAFFGVLVLGLEYCFFMNPRERYYLQMCTGTFLAILLSVASGVLFATVCYAAFWVVAQSNGLPTYTESQVPLLTKGAGASRPVLVLNQGEP